MPKAKPFIACSCDKCRPKTVEDILASADHAKKENPANGPSQFGVAVLMSTAVIGDTRGGGEVDIPQAIALLTAKYWGPATRVFSVQFLDNPNQATRKKILSYMNKWNLRCGVSFVETKQTGLVRINRGPDGYWSYLGTDVGRIRSGPTMNLQDFTEKTADSEYDRVVTHETGHTLGCPHEHMRTSIISKLDVEKTVRYFQQHYGWGRQTTLQQVFTPISELSVRGTPANETSIMCYDFAGECTKNGKPIVGGSKITESDYAFMATQYPKTGSTKK